MIKNNRIKGEIWVGLEGIPFAVRAEEIKEENDGKVTFIRLVESKDGNHGNSYWPAFAKAPARRKKP